MKRVRWLLVLLNLIVTAVVLAFFSCAPLLGFPADWEESFSLAQGVLPVFLGNIGFAAAFAAQTPVVADEPIDDERLHLLTLIAFGSIAVFVTISVVVCGVYWYSHRRDIPMTVSGMSLPTLQTILSAALGVNTATSNHLLVRLFPNSNKKNRSTSK